jgi:hypothetical protein
MSQVPVSVARYELCVDAADTIRAVLDCGDTDAGGPLAEALRFACTEFDVLAVPASGPLRPGELLPGHGSADVAEVSAHTADNVLSALRQAGYVGAYDLSAETHSEAYLSTGRTLTAVHVLRPFALVAVACSWSNPDADRPADRCEITGRSGPVQPGWYVVGVVGDVYGRTVVGAANVEADDSDHPKDTAERLAGWADNVEGFSASHCAAGCNACGARWYAESGSWQFRPDGDSATDVDGWDFDDVDDVDDRGMIACPACHTGRVGFSIC